MMSEKNIQLNPSQRLMENGRFQQMDEMLTANRYGSIPFGNLKIVWSHTFFGA
jgi:hypothetical protein